MGVSTQAVSRWECGTSCPDILSLPCLAELFNITVDELLGADEKEKKPEIDKIIKKAEEKIDKGVTEEPISTLRKSLKKFPNNDRLLCSLMYALYAASEDEEFCREHDEEIIGIAYHIEEYSRNEKCRTESLRWLFRHYCDTNRKIQAMQIAEKMPSIENSYERNIYWALSGSEKAEYLKQRISDDMHYLFWDLAAYAKNFNINDKAYKKINMIEADLHNIITEQIK